MTATEHTLELDQKQLDHVNKYPNLKKLYSFKIEGNIAIFNGAGCQYKAREFGKLINGIK